MKEKWITQQQLANELTEKYGEKITIQRVSNWVRRGNIDSKVVYGKLVVVDRDSLKIDFEKNNVATNNLVANKK